MKIYAITGSDGFIGHALAEHILKSGGGGIWN